jgi:AraC family transcriptional regulator
LPDLANLDYVDRVNRAIDYITANLSDSLKLEDVARAAHFSPFHFHRIFRSLVGETLHDFVKRVRCERALHLMSHRGQRSLTEIALACGFASSSDFSRSFRQQFGVSPRRFDVEAFRRTNRDALIGSRPAEKLAHPAAGSNPDGFAVRLRSLPERRVAYLRVFRPYEGTNAHDAVMRHVSWARERGLAGGQWLGYQWDDPDIVPLDRCRYDIGVEVPETATIDGAASEVRFAPMTVAEVEIRGGVDLELRCLDWLYTTWLPHSGFTPDHQPGFEAFVGEPFAHGTEYFELQVHLPVIDSGTRF